MPQELEAPKQAPAVSTRRDLQRESLDGLIRLVRECAAEETRIENERAAAQAKADKVLQIANDAVNRKYQAIEQSVRDLYLRRVTEADKQLDWARDDLSSKGKTRRRTIQHEYDKSAEDLKTNHDQSVWLADSVLEAAEIRIKEEYQKTKDRAAAAALSLEELEKKAAEALMQLGQGTPEVPDEPVPEPEPGRDPGEAFETHRQAAEKHVSQLGSNKLAQLGSGSKPLFLMLVVFVVLVSIPQIAAQTLTPQWVGIGIMAAVALGIILPSAFFLKKLAKMKVVESFAPFRYAMNAAFKAAEAMTTQADMKRETDLTTAKETRKKEVQGAKDKLNPLAHQALKARDTQTQAIRNEVAKRVAELEKQRDASRTATDAWQNEILPKLKKRHLRHIGASQEAHDAKLFNAHVEHDKARTELEQRWADGLLVIRQPANEGSRAIADWSPETWDAWKPPKTFTETIRFGEIQVDLKKIVESAAPEGKFTLPLPDAFSLPALLAFPRQSSLMIHSDPAGRLAALKVLELVMVRLLTCLPAGRVRFTVIDPVGLGQNFSGFMHLGDFDEALIGTKIWTSREHIDQRLLDLTEHMETVIQKYLRNEFETIDQYNAQAGELAEPYRFLVIADFPAEFEADSLRRLSSIATTGARCGVYTLIARDIRLQVPSGAHFDDVEAHSVNLVHDKDHFVWKDDIFRQFPLTLDGAPPDETLTKILQKVGKGAKEASKIEVPFESITPKPAQYWSQSSATDLSVPVGRMGATRLQHVRLGRGVAQHALIAGKTGSGKSSLLNAMITNTALWYSPAEVMLYLIDFKKGVEFKSYATHNLPHAKAIAVESDREFGLSVLQRIDSELSRRGELYRKYGAQDLGAYRGANPTDPMPRILLIIDEFQEFFSEDDKISQEAGLLLDRLVRQGRAFGIHVFLGSQTLAGSSGLSRSTIGQMGVRVALQCSDADSQLILGDNNSAARLLSRPGEAIYNDAGGLVEGNSPFQVAWLPDETRDKMLDAIAQTAKERLGEWEPPIVFEGNSPAPIIKNVPLAKLLDEPKYGKPPLAPAAWLGDPVAIKSPTAALFRRQSGANLLMIGQQEEAAMAMTASVLSSLAAQYPKGGAKFVIFDGSPADSPLASILPAMKEILPNEVKLVDFRAIPDAINELAEEFAARSNAEPTSAHMGGEEIFVLIYGVQRYRVLKKQDDGFGFSGGDEEKKADPGKQFADLLRDGPNVGIHVIAWIDTPANIDRILDRTAMREFDYRVLFQMSANDSSNLIDSPAANKLGVNRAMIYSEEQGTMEKFRPYALPDKEWLDRLQTALARKNANTPAEPH